MFNTVDRQNIEAIQFYLLSACRPKVKSGRRDAHI